MGDPNPPDPLHGDSYWAQVAHKYWLASSKKIIRVQPTVIQDELWIPLEKEAFASAAVHTLEGLQLLEEYLWPGYNDDSSNNHVLLIALILNAKRAESLPTWSILDRPADFSSLFRRILSSSIDTSLSPKLRVQLLITIIGAFGSLDNGLVRKECAPLVSISIWQHLRSDAARTALLETHPQFKKAWRASNKRHEAADKETQARQRFERGWLFTLLNDFLDILYDQSRQIAENRVYCERFMELLTDLQSQFPTRRYVNTLLQDLNLLVLLKQSPLYRDEDSALFRDFYLLLRHYTFFPIDDHTGRQLSRQEVAEAHTARLAQLQRNGLKHFPEKLRLLALSNYGSIEKRDELSSHLNTLSDEELKELIVQLGFRSEYASSAKLNLGRPFLLEVLLTAHEAHPTFQESVQDTPVMPTDQSLYEASFSRNDSYDGTRPLALPKVNLQYLTIGDFLWRSFTLFRCEAFYSIRREMEDVVKRLQPEWHFRDQQTMFKGKSRMACRISRPAIVEITSPKVGESLPAEVRAEIILDVAKMGYALRSEWESLKPDDVVFLLGVKAEENNKILTNGIASQQSGVQAPFRCLRCAEVVQIQDENRRPLRKQSNQANGQTRRPRQLRIIVKLEASAHQEDVAKKEKGREDVYEGINVLVKRRSRENNFKRMLESIQKMTLSEVPLPSWLQDVFLGLGDPTGASYQKLPNALTSVDFRDTFLDWAHLRDSLPDVSVKSQDGAEISPPYVLTPSSQPEAPAEESPKKSSKTSKKRKRGEEADVPTAKVEVSSYKPQKMGPYPSDEPKTNAVRFTPAQVEAIRSGTQPGLTVVVGPPGTGKTDVATQIINNIYHNFPSERTLLVAHSNQALNQLFQKIVALDIDERHLLRLGHGEGELQLDTDANFGKAGRVDSFLEIGGRYLNEVSRLAVSMDAPGAHGNSCETADYFNTVYVKPAWNRYWEHVQSPDATVESVIEDFPFHIFFSNAPQPVFSPNADKDTVLEVAQGCHRHIEKIFSELEDIRPFEVLRSDRTKENYLLVKEARIIAMTSTHAAIRRQQIADLGFTYDNIIMEEAAQITEIETFIPLALQHPPKPKSISTVSDTALKRVILCGDHLQNSPIIQNLAFRQYANLEQSLFLRLVRLGVPTILLDKQGRARPSLASLYSWRYSHLGNLPLVSQQPEFLNANAGFAHDFQFIDVPDYKGKGEMEPTPHFLQNLGEAEYAVALFMYMRLLGYPASRISILTMYAGQRALIRDVLNHRCKDNRLFGLPRIVATVDKYQGEQNDHIILSLVRTTRIGYLRDIRRLTVALSRARLGLYILGRRSVFESVPELKPAFDRLFARPTSLKLVQGEMHPTSRQVGEAVAEGKEVEMQGVEHLGQWVFEMTGAKMRDLREGKFKVVEPEAGHGMVGDEEDEDVDGEDEVDLDEGDENLGEEEVRQDEDMGEGDAAPDDAPDATVNSET